uniref:Uncharacterized protein n=1 Tax=Candidatus Kentrum sp. MB TaxID=2138164 RepID=A0A451BFX6_9GAMM|nr:MAG: hypothetical protein BECKMB1821G_GA0114241_104716 [Candidatus Kentron sp. MB]VFK35217.1 MAG: hypothetical protein BECKMB1821I_GA0114274_11052 [Candidatus Kentron sp. MB]VFK77172.1 MAG: hypothetical protein BECKMB1821H_GA0114242_11062 [Candidatus Kentron sp. MB]
MIVSGLLLEYGIVIPKGKKHVRKQLLEIIEDENNGLTQRSQGENSVCSLYSYHQVESNSILWQEFFSHANELFTHRWFSAIPDRIMGS